MSDISLDRSSKVMFTLKNSALYPLPSSRKLTNYVKLTLFPWYAFNIIYIAPFIVENR